MDPMTIGLITAGIPFVTSLFKKLLSTDKLADSKRKGINTLIPIILGILSVGMYNYTQTGDWVTALAVGLGSGGVASSARNVEKNLVGLVQAIASLFVKKK